MKKISAVLLVVVMFVFGCTGGNIQVTQESQEAIAKIMARRVGYELAKEYPEIAVQVSAVCQEIIAQEEPDLVRIAINGLIVVLAAEIDDPLLAADIRDILKLIEIESGIEITDEHMSIVKNVAEALASGIDIYNS